MKYLIYTSKASEDIKATDIRSILESAINYNIKRNITGMLVFKKYDFFQILEGNESEIWKLYNDRIKKDFRHHSLEIVSFEKSKQRIFKDWSMGLCNPEFASKECYALNEFFIANYFYERLPSLNCLPTKLLHSFIGMKHQFYFRQ